MYPNRIRLTRVMGIIDALLLAKDAAHAVKSVPSVSIASSLRCVDEWSLHGKLFSGFAVRAERRKNLRRMYLRSAQSNALGWVGLVGRSKVAGRSPPVAGLDLGLLGVLDRRSPDEGSNGNGDEGGELHFW
jgi:hypothetical protein